VKETLQKFNAITGRKSHSRHCTLLATAFLHDPAAPESLSLFKRPRKCCSSTRATIKSAHYMNVRTPRRRAVLVWRISRHYQATRWCRYDRHPTKAQSILFHSAYGQLHVVERYRLVDDGRALEVAFTVDDPVHSRCPGRQASGIRRSSDRWRRLSARGEAFAPIQDATGSFPSARRRPISECGSGSVKGACVCNGIGSHAVSLQMLEERTCPIGADRFGSWLLCTCGILRTAMQRRG